MTLEGFGLHSGRPGRVSIERSRGPVALRVGDRRAAIADLTYSGDGRATIAEASGLRVATVEHLFAALAGRGVYEGVEIVVEGFEVPIADGGAAMFFDAIDAPATSPLLAVARAAEITVDASTFRFEPGDAVGVEVELEVDDVRIETHARWDGDPEDFRTRIAPARTFAFEKELADIVDRGLAHHVPPTSVVVIGERILSAGAPFAADEPARHKLLDLMGDLYAYGGPPKGLVRATRPGHRANHAAVKKALTEGILVRVTTL